MSRLLEFWNRIRDRARRDRLAAELDEELRFHQSMLERDFHTAGTSATAAARAASRQLGNRTHIHEGARDTWTLSWFDDALQDLRYASRVLRRSPAFSLAVIGTLALGIGANTATFSIINAVVLRPLPYADADRLYSLWTVPADRQAERLPVSYPDLVDWQMQSTAFTGIGGYAYNRFELSGPEGVDAARSISGTPSVYAVLGAQPLIGRLPVAAEERLPVLAISHRLWMRRYAGDRAVVGRTVLVNDERFTIVGVMPPGFHFPSPDIDLWMSMYTFSGAPGRPASGPWITSRGLRGFRTIARLKPGVTVAGAERELNIIMDRLGRDYPNEDAATDVRLQSIRDDTVGGVRRALYVTLGAAGLVLLLACANVAHLMLARSSTRAREMAVRRALGAGRGRVIRQLLTESICLGAVGGAVGLLIAAIAVRVLVRLAPADIPRLENVALDAHALGFAAAVSVVTGVLFGLAPTLLAARTNTSLRETRGSASGGRMRTALTSAEVAFAVIVLIAAGLMVRSLASLLSTDLGFRPERLVSLHVSFPSVRYPNAADRAPTLERLLARIRAIPGVTAAGGSTSLPPSRMQQANGFMIEGDPEPRPNQEPSAIFVPVTAQFLPALGAPLVRGRQFTDGDDAVAPRVVIISRSLAQRYFAGREPVGRRVRVQDSLWTIVGVVGELSYQGVAKGPDPTMYVPFAQSSFGGAWIVVRASREPRALMNPIAEAIASVDPRMNARELRTMDDVVADTMVRPRFQAWLLTTFAGLALILAAVGIYGVVAYTVSQRTFEIGLRLALGASRGNVVSLVLWRGLRPVLIGLAIGVVVALAASRVMIGLLYGVSPTDATTFVGVLLLLASVAIAAIYLPATRASRLAPTIALKGNG
jgi:putative ABC transport system permease protein